jgi:hypothetical protein
LIMKSLEETQRIMTFRKKSGRSKATIFVSLAVALAAAQACKGSNPAPSEDDDNVINPGGSENDDGSGGRSNTKTGGRGNTASGGRTGQSSGGRANTSSGGRNIGGEGGDPGSPSGGAETGIGGGFVEPPRGDCEDEPNGEGCWDLTKCNGVETIQFLEQCGGTCQAPFDNEGFTGTLPPLP